MDTPPTKRKIITLLVVMPTAFKKDTLRSIRKQRNTKTAMDMMMRNTITLLE
jgi:hypothetical protein